MEEAEAVKENLQAVVQAVRVAVVLVQTEAELQVMEPMGWVVEVEAVGRAIQELVDEVA